MRYSTFNRRSLTLAILTITAIGHISIPAYAEQQATDTVHTDTVSTLIDNNSNAVLSSEASDYPVVLNPIDPAILIPFEQRFKSTIKGLSVKTKRSLSMNDDGTYVLKTTSKNIMASYAEESHFTLDKSQRLSPISYRVKSRVFGVKRVKTVSFDWQTGVATYQKNDDIRTVDILPGMLDRSVYQLQLQSDLMHGNHSPRYHFVDKGRVKSYQFGLITSEEDSRDDLVRVARADQKADDLRKTHIWMSPANNYELVRIYHRDKEGDEYKMDLKR